MATPITRRTLLASTAAVGAGLLLPGTAAAATRGAISTVTPWDRIVILIELDGGNDGLNTVVPYNVPEYISRRPTLRYAGTALAPTSIGQATYRTVQGNRSEQFALNPAMTHLMKAWNPATPAEHDLAVVLGVGYPSANFSHFRSMDIWNGGSNFDQFPADCWLGRLFAGAGAPPASLTAYGALLSRYSSNPLKRDGIRYLAMSKPSEFIDRSFELKETKNTKASSPSPHFDHLLKTQQEVFEAAGRFRAALLTPKVANPSQTRKEDWNYTPPTFTPHAEITFNDNSAFEKRCKSIAEMISTTTNADPAKRLQIPVYKVQIGGFDHHSDQKLKHEDLLAQVSSGMASLRRAMIQKGLWNRVLIMTYSEFGRRPEENGSAGTDHGSANCHFLMGGGIKGGIYGEQPGLYNPNGNVPKDLENGNLKQNVDFRRLYATVATWMGLPLDGSLTGHAPLDCLY